MKYEDTRKKGRDTPGCVAFTVLRLLDPILQYCLISWGWGFLILDAIGLEPRHEFVMGAIPPVQQLMIFFAIGSAVKQSYWAWFIGEEQFGLKMAIPIALLNFTVNMINTVVSLWLSYGRFLGPLQYLGALCFIAGLYGEWWSEEQRKSFKKKSSNRGKLFTGGLWAYARHINYGSYAIWRTGYSLATGSATLGVMTLVFWYFLFHYVSVPQLSGYLAKKYGEQWRNYKKKTPFELWPEIN